MDLSHYHLSASPFFDGSCGAWPKVPDEFLGQAPNLVFFFMGMEFPTMGKSLRANPTAQEEVL